MSNTCKVSRSVSACTVKPLLLTFRIMASLLLLYILIIPFMNRATACTVKACPQNIMENVIFDKNMPLGSEVVLDSALFGITGNPLYYEWCGPFTWITGPNPLVFIPEGTYAVTLVTNNGIQRSSPATLYFKVEPDYSVFTAAFKGKVVLTWFPVKGVQDYKIFRALEIDPSHYQQIAELHPSALIYTDSGLKDATYLYVIGALVNGAWTYSHVSGAHPFSTCPKLNYPPVIYTNPVIPAIVGLPYTYTVLAADPQGDAVTYSLVNPPVGMTINAKTGLICWVPQSNGDYEVIVKACDGRGGSTYQTYIIEANEMPALNRNPVANAGGPYTAQVGRNILFNGSASYDPDGDPLQFAWSFGDGLAGSGVTPSHSYTTPGTYPVTLTVSDGKGGTASASTTATVTQCMKPSVQFSIDPSAAHPGDPCTLIWSTGNATSVSIDKGIGTVSASGTVTVHPQATTTYTITAVSSCGTASQSATVIVSQPPMVNMSAVPGTIVSGQTSQLSWTSANAATLTIDQGIGSVIPNGSLSVSPAITTTYTITATGPGGTTTATATITVFQPPHVSISVQPLTIIEGDSATLTWSSDHADSASLDNGIGSVDVKGSMPVSPTDTATYTITVQGPGGTATASTTVTVRHKPTVTITASPNPINAGDITTLTWTTTNADSATIDSGIGDVDVNGSMDREIDDPGPFTFTITVTGPGGTATASVTVEVLAPPAQRNAYAYFTNRNSNDVSVVDLTMNAVISHIEVGYGPYGVAVSPDGDTAYVTSAEKGISIIDAASNTITRTIPVFVDTIAVSPDGKSLYGVSMNEGTLKGIDIATGAVVKSIEAGPTPHGITVNNEGTRIYVSSLDDGKVRVIDATTLGVIAEIAVTKPGDPIWDVEVSPCGSKVYAVSCRFCTLTVIDGKTNSVTGSHPYHSHLGEGESFISECNLAVSPYGQMIALSDISMSIMPRTIYLIDSQSLDVLSWFPAVAPSDLTFTADGSVIYCPDSWINGVYYVDMCAQWFEGTIEGDFSDPSTYGHFIAEHKEKISGRVVSDGSGVEGVVVSLSNDNINLCISSDSQGQYFFYATPGQYTISYSGNGYVLSNQSRAVDVEDKAASMPDVEVLLGVRMWAEPFMIINGSSTVLHWSSAKTANVTIDHGIGTVSASGSLAVSPPETSTYSITATDAQGMTVTDHVTIMVYQLPTVSINADPHTIIQGQSVIISWTSTNADTLFLERMGTNVGASGSFLDAPWETTTYTITATGPGGTATASVTVTVYIPPTVTITADPSTIYAGQSSTLTRTSTDAEQVSIDNGIGNVGPNGSLVVSPAQTSTYTITAAGPGGTATASVTITVNSVINITIDSPTNGATINRPDILVRGTVSNAYNNETGITINGTPAVVCQGRYFVNHVPLTDGSNTITVHAMDTQGNSLDKTIAVTANTTQPYITLSPVDSFGIAPFDTNLNINAVFTPDSLSFSDTSQGQIQYLTGTDPSTWTASIPSSGVYYITAQATYSGYTFTDTIGVIAYDKASLDAMLRQKWEAMRTALLNNDIQAAVKDISSRTQSNYQDIFSSLTPEHRASLVAELGDIQLINMSGNKVEYDIQTIRNGTRYSFYLLFEIDDMDGRWKIANF